MSTLTLTRRGRIVAYSIGALALSLTALDWGGEGYKDPHPYEPMIIDDASDIADLTPGLSLSTRD